MKVVRRLQEPLAKWFAARPLVPRTEIYTLESGTSTEEQLGG